MNWIEVKGGVFGFGDYNRERVVKRLLWMCTPLTYGDLGISTKINDIPVTGIDFFEALKIAKQLNARLPSTIEWELMAGGEESRLYPWGDEPWNEKLANILPSSLKGISRVGCYPNGTTPEGVLDVAGNVWEWTTSICANEGIIIRGGSYKSKEIYCKTKFFNAAPKELKSPGIGLRLVRDII